MKLAPLFIIALTASFCGSCVMQAAQMPHDVMSDLDIGSPDLKNLTVAVIYSENTKQGLHFQQSSITGQPGFKPEVWFQDMIGLLGRRFKRTITVERIEDASVSNADLVAVVDDLAEFNRGSAKLGVRMRVIFTTPDRQQVDVVEGENDRNAIMWTHGTMGAAAKTAQERFFRALAASAKLQTFARSIRTGPAVAVRSTEGASVSSDLDELPSARPESKRRHAVVIGVERYRENLPRADFAASDARLAAEYFKRVLGVPEANLALLIDDHATNTDLQKYFERWLPNRVEAGDEVFVYFSGHGAPNPKSGDAYLVPFDGDPTYIAETGYSIKKLYAQLAKLPAKRVLVAMDSCFSGAGGRSVIAKGARPLVSVQAEAVTGNVSVLSASAGDQISNSYQEKGHGLFTYFLLKGLKEKGGDFKAAFDYLKPEVSKIARREYNADQDPQWREGK